MTSLYFGIEITAAIFASACLFGACSDNKDIPTASYSYGPELGLASGNVDLSSDSPDINISDIKSPVGENIDFLSGVTVINEEDYEDLEVWADASTIDIFTPGDYKVVYTFKYSGKSISKEINVTIFEPDNEEPELSESIIPSSNLADNKETETKPNGGSVNKTTKPNSATAQDNPGIETNTTAPVATTKPNVEPNTKPVTTTKPSTTQTTKPVTTTKPNSGQTTTKKDSTTREIITTKGNKTTENKYIGNYTIELLSGKTITVKNSTSKYIVSTRTENSEITKKGSRYKVSKLIIRYNTGTEQILEIVEEKIG